MENMLFRREERCLVEERYLDSPLYEFLTGACKLLMGETSQVVLHPSELFYQSFLVLDTLRCKTTKLGVAYCHELLWNELLYYFKENLHPIVATRTEHDEPPTFQVEMNLAIGCIMQASAELLARAGCEYISAACALKLQIERHAPLMVKRLDQAFRCIFRTMDEETVADTITQYMESENMYSEEINEMLDSMETDETEVSQTGASASAQNPQGQYRATETACSSYANTISLDVIAERILSLPSKERGQIFKDLNTLLVGTAWDAKAKDVLLQIAAEEKAHEAEQRLQPVIHQTNIEHFTNQTGASYLDFSDNNIDSKALAEVIAKQGLSTSKQGLAPKLETSNIQ